MASRSRSVSVSLIKHKRASLGQRLFTHFFYYYSRPSVIVTAWWSAQSPLTSNPPLEALLPFACYPCVDDCFLTCTVSWQDTKQCEWWRLYFCLLPSDSWGEFRTPVSVITSKYQYYCMMSCPDAASLFTNTDKSSERPKWHCWGWGTDKRQCLSAVTGQSSRSSGSMLCRISSQ